MSLIEIPPPKERDLRFFGIMAGCMLAAAGGLAAWRFGVIIGLILWLAAVVFMAPYYLVRPLQRVFYYLWMGLFFPLGWILSHLLFAFIYFLVITPIGLALRLAGRDALGMHTSATTYWHRRPLSRDPERYFRQY